MIRANRLRSQTWPTLDGSGTDGLICSPLTQHNAATECSPYNISRDRLRCISICYQPQKQGDNMFRNVHMFVHRCQLRSSLCFSTWELRSLPKQWTYGSTLMSWRYHLYTCTALRLFLTIGIWCFSMHLILAIVLDHRSTAVL